MASLISPPVETGSLIDRILDEGPLGMSAAARLLGTFRDGKPTHASTPTRWHFKGVRLPDGRLIRLEAVRLNGRLVTSRAALVRFIAAQQPDAPAADAPVGPGPSSRRKASEAAAAELQRRGC